PLVARALPLAALGVLLGAATHLGWDAFTHRWGAGVRLVPALAEPVFSVGSYTVWGYRLAQHASTVAGLALIGWMLARWARRTPPRLPASRTVSARVWAAMAAATLVGGVTAVAVEWSPGSGLFLDDLRTFAWPAVTGSVTGLAVAVAVFVTSWHLRGDAATHAET
ncbi:MAG: DUF4184 family protein, partial [Deltaproteobacteria bacterium]